jgi:hypothetical protein
MTYNIKLFTYAKNTLFMQVFEYKRTQYIINEYKRTQMQAIEYIYTLSIIILITTMSINELKRYMSLNILKH